MTVLYLVPQAYLAPWRQQQKKAMTLRALVAHILKEGLQPYKTDQIAEGLALWQAVWENKGQLVFLAPIAHYPGFLQELRWLIWQIDAGEEVLSGLSEQGRLEVEMLRQAYHRLLEKKGVLDGQAQLRQALKLSTGRMFLPEVSALRLAGLGELSPLEQKLIASFAQGRPIQKEPLSVSQPRLEVFKAQDPYEEVAMMGQAIRGQLEQGVSLGAIAVAFPNPSQYLPILRPLFEKLRLPLAHGPASLENTPLGKALLAFFSAQLEGWQKHHLQLLTAPGWGLPFSLTAEERRRLRLGPLLKGLPAWNEYLGDLPGWAQFLESLQQLGEFTTQSMGAWGDWLLQFLEMCNIPASSPEHWAFLQKAQAGLEEMARGLQNNGWALTPGQFASLLRMLLGGYEIRGPRFFFEELQVLSLDELGAYAYEQLYVGGLVEGQFPPLRRTHWLTKMQAAVDEQELERRLKGSAAQLYFFYPETDKEGKLNLPSRLLAGTKARPGPVDFAAPKPTLFLGDGHLKDAQLLRGLQTRLLEDGLSVSELNYYANCPYQFYCSYVLQLKPEEEVSLELDPRERGSILHRVLYNFWRGYLQKPLPTLKDALATVEGLLRREYNEAGQELPPAVLRTFREFIRQDLYVVEQGFRPHYLERDLAGFTVTTELGPVQIRGFIDRIDMNREGQYVLYDYKTGSAPSLAEILKGADLQIATYLVAAQKLIPAGRNVGIAYYLTQEKRRVGIFHEDFHRQLLIRGGKHCLTDQQFEEQLLFFKEKIAGMLHQIFAGHFPIEPANSRMCSYCPYQGICRKEVAG